MHSNGTAHLRALTFVLVAALTIALMTLGTTGCAPQSSSTATESPTKSAAEPSVSTQASSETTPQMCADCGGKGMAPMVKGETETEDGGVQVLKVGVKEGYYDPNVFTVDAGAPVKVVFTGSAKGCLAKPMFPTLKKKGDFTSGTTTIDLGTLEPGAYDFTCGMKMVGGKITVQ